MQRLSSADASFGWKHCTTDVFKKFLSAFVVQLDNAFEQPEFWIAFDILDPYKLSSKKEDLIQSIQWQQDVVQDLGKHYSTQKVNRFKGKVNMRGADIDTTALTAEQSGNCSNW